MSEWSPARLATMWGHTGSERLCGARGFEPAGVSFVVQSRCPGAGPLGLNPGLASYYVYDVW